MKKNILFVIVIMSVSILFSCNSSPDEKVVDVVAKDFSFQVVDEIPSGWANFKFKNEGHAEHFFLLNLLPDSIDFRTYHNQVTKPFDIVFDSIKAGMSKGDAIALLLKLIPPWYFTSVKQMGGAGIINPGMSEIITLNLKPGTYVMECYIKEKGVFHTALGMIRPIKVTDEKSKIGPPNSNLDITLTNSKIDTNGKISAGKNTIAVYFKEQPKVGLGNDVHIIKITDKTDMNKVIEWLDWMNIKGLESPAPVEFLGGCQEMPVGYTCYFQVDLEKGKYAFIAESGADRGLIKQFQIE